MVHVIDPTEAVELTEDELNAVGDALLDYLMANTYDDTDYYEGAEAALTKCEEARTALVVARRKRLADADG